MLRAPFFSQSRAGNFCTGYGQGCINCGSRDRSGDRGKDCGCGQGESGCQECGVCATCGAQVPCGPPALKVAPASEPEITSRFKYAAQVFAAAVVSHCESASGQVAPQQLIQTWLQTYCQHLRSQMEATKSFMHLHQIMNAAQQILIEGSCRVEPPSNLISRFGGLSSEQQEAHSQHLIKSSQSGASSESTHAVQAAMVSKLVCTLTATQPPRDSASQKLINDFLDAVNRVSCCVDEPLQQNELKWSVSPSMQGCGTECSSSHSGDGNCLVCGLGWSPHNGHNCTRSPFAGRRGSWLSSSRAAPVASVHVEKSPGMIKASFDPKSTDMLGIQSDSPLDSNPDKEVGTIITFDIVHSSASTPRVIVGLSLTPPPLTAPVAAKVSLGLDLGNLNFIGNVEIGEDNPAFRLSDRLKMSLSLSPSVIK
jgi:hypothetical protein